MNRRGISNSLAFILVVSSAVLLSACLSGVQCPPPGGVGAAVTHPFGGTKAPAATVTCSSGGNGGGGNCSTSVKPNNVVYTLDGSGNVLEYAIDPVSGGLTLMCNTAVTAAGGLPVVSNNNFLYVFDPSVPQIFAFSIQHGNSGALTPVTNQPFSIKLQAGETLSGSSSFMEADPLGRFLFVTNEAFSLVHVYSISATSPGLGALTEVANSPFSVASPSHLVVDRTGAFAFVADPVDGEILIFSLSSSGQLTPGNPASLLQDSGADAPHFLLEHPTLSVLYSANAGSISALTINTGTGNLTQVPGSPFTTAGTGVSPDFLAINSTGAFIYTNDSAFTGGILGELLDSGTGALTGEAPGAPFPVIIGATGLLQVISNPAGANIYAVVSASATEGFVVNYPITLATGALASPAASTLMAETNLVTANVQ